MGDGHAFGMRIRVIDVLNLLASGLSPAEVLKELPDLEKEDIEAALRYASFKLDHCQGNKRQLHLAFL